MPATVRIATAVQFATAGLTAVGATLAVLTTAHLLDAVESAMRAQGAGYDDATAASFVTGLFSYVLIGVWAAGALLVALFAFGYRHEVERWTRVATWTFALPVALLGVRAMDRAATPRTGLDDAEFLALTGRALDRAIPGWWPPALVVLEVLTAVAYLAIVALLATPAARAWFRRPREDHSSKPP
ncbi:hypothetical protein Pen01_61170 [Phytomonospora endophytica]|nr:hypothetical protein Pen01_61170 [Phytomonospora endophytica]